MFLLNKIFFFYKLFKSLFIIKWQTDLGKMFQLQLRAGKFYKFQSKVSADFFKFRLELNIFASYVYNTLDSKGKIQRGHLEGIKHQINCTLCFSGWYYQDLTEADVIVSSSDRREGSEGECALNLADGVIQDGLLRESGKLGLKIQEVNHITWASLFRKSQRILSLILRRVYKSVSACIFRIALQFFITYPG